MHIGCVLRSGHEVSLKTQAACPTVTGVTGTSSSSSLEVPDGALPPDFLSPADLFRSREAPKTATCARPDFVPRSGPWRDRPPRHPRQPRTGPKAGARQSSVSVLDTFRTALTHFFAHRPQSQCQHSQKAILFCSFRSRLPSHRAARCYCLDAAQRVKRGMEQDSLWRKCNPLLYNCTEWPCATASCRGSPRGERGLQSTGLRWASSGQ